METEAHEDIPLLAKRGRRWPILLSVVLLLVLIGATVLVFIGQSDQSTSRSANAVRDLPTDIHWQRAFQSGFLPTLVAAPSDPTILYLCNDQNMSSGSGFVLARSTDAGIHWLVLTTHFSGNAGCQVTVNPTNASDLYVTLSQANYENNNMKVNYTLKHSSDGGQTWATIAPVLMLSATQHVAWNGLGVGFVGRRLFATQILNGASHLISSPDGGQTWTVVDGQLLTSHQELLSAAVDPSVSGTIYEIVGPIIRGWFSYAPSSTPVPTPTPLSVTQLSGQLYKTTNGGITWQKLLSSVPYEEKIQLATANPHLLYLGGFSHKGKNTFQVQVSRNSGATWQTVSLPVHAPLLSDWFVDATGVLYNTAKYIGSPRSGNQWLALGSIPRYNPSTDQWSTLNIPTDATWLLTITPAGSNRGDILWMTNLDGELYRGTA